eukprot:5233825-Amphidinium_carterae.1
MPVRHLDTECNIDRVISLVGSDIQSRPSNNTLVVTRHAVDNDSKGPPEFFDVAKLKGVSQRGPLASAVWEVQG